MEGGGIGFVAPNHASQIASSTSSDCASGIEPDAVGPADGRERGRRIEGRGRTSEVQVDRAAVPERIGGRLGVLVDEYEVLVKPVREGRLSPEGVPFLASLLDRELPVSHIFTGSRHIEESDSRIWQRLLGRAYYKRISFLDREDASPSSAIL